MNKKTFRRRIVIGLLWICRKLDPGFLFELKRYYEEGENPVNPLEAVVE